MAKYSIIIPAYNVEKFIKKCIDSILNQTLKNYEIIVVNDGSTDKTLEILNNYKESIKIYSQENKGLSEARNFGIKKSTGEYLLFIDSDDYVDKDLLKKIDEKTKSNPDLIRYSYSNIINGKVVKTNESLIEGLYNGKDAFILFLNNKKPFEMAWIYAYKKSFWLKNNFQYSPNKYHEDFGLTPIVILKAETIEIINNELYYYVQSENSIMRNKNIEKILKKSQDMIYHYDNLKNIFDNLNITDDDLKKMFYSYISNALISKAKELDKYNLNNYLSQLKERKIFDNLIEDNIKRKVKKIIIKIFPKIYIELSR